MAFCIPYRCDFGQRIKVVGSDPGMGAWNPDHAVALTWSQGDLWIGETRLHDGLGVEYKYVVTDQADIPQRWMDGENIRVSLPNEGCWCVVDTWDHSRQGVAVLEPPSTSVVDPDARLPVVAAAAQEGLIYSIDPQTVLVGSGVVSTDTMMVEEEHPSTSTSSEPVVDASSAADVYPMKEEATTSTSTADGSEIRSEPSQETIPTDSYIASPPVAAVASDVTHPSEPQPQPQSQSKAFSGSVDELTSRLRETQEELERARDLNVVLEEERRRAEEGPRRLRRRAPASLARHSERTRLLRQIAAESYRELRDALRGGQEALDQGRDPASVEALQFDLLLSSMSKRAIAISRALEAGEPLMDDGNSGGLFNKGLFGATREDEREHSDDSDDEE